MLGCFYDAKGSLKLEFVNSCYRNTVNILIAEVTQLQILHSFYKQEAHGKEAS